MSELLSMRLDKWLWAARFFKTRALAAEAIDKGRVEVNDSSAKRSRDVRVGDHLCIHQPQGAPRRFFTIQGLSATRGPAPQAQLLYEETAESQKARLDFAEQRRLAAEPGHSFKEGRPTKKDRRDLAEWDRWSASLD